MPLVVAIGGAAHGVHRHAGKASSFDVLVDAAADYPAVPGVESA
jgi:hypothetical protein